VANLWSFRHKFSSAERAQLNYLAPSDNLDRTLKDVVARGVEGIRTSSVKRAIKLKNCDNLKTLIKEEKDGGEDLSIYWQSGPIHASLAHRHELLHKPCLR